MRLFNKSSASVSACQQKIRLPKTILIVAALVSLSLNFVHAEISLISKGKVSLTDEDIRAAFKDLTPDTVAEMKKNPKVFLQFVEGIFDNKYISIAILEKIKDDADFKRVQPLDANRFANQFFFKKAIHEQFASIDFKVLAKQEFAANKGKYVSPATQDFYHILFIKENNLNAEDPKVKAESVLADIRAGKITMSEAAKQYQVSFAGVDEAGVLKAVQANQLLPEINTAVVGMKVGDVSDLIISQAGYHIISLKQNNPSDVPEYTPALEEKIILSLQTETQRRTIADLKSTYLGDEQVTLNSTEIDALIENLLGVKPVDPDAGKKALEAAKEADRIKNIPIPTKINQ